MQRRNYQQKRKAIVKWEIYTRRIYADVMLGCHIVLVVVLDIRKGKVKLRFNIREWFVTYNAKRKVSNTHRQGFKHHPLET